MHELFASWYSQIWPPDATRLHDRWETVESLVATLTPEVAIDYAALAFGRKTITSEVSESIRDAAIRFDATYVPTKDTHELSLLASATIVGGLRSSSLTSDALALTLSCIAFGSGVLTTIQRQLLSICEKYISESIMSFRRSQSGHRIGFRTESQTDPDFCGAELKQELFDVLLLVNSRYSPLLDKPFSELKRVVSIFVASYELAAITRFAPVVNGYAAVLHSLIRESKGREKLASIRELVKSLPSMITQRIAEQFSSISNSLPCHYAVMKWNEIGEESTWSKTYSLSTELNPDARYPLLELARQIYMEQMVCRLLFIPEKKALCSAAATAGFTSGNSPVLPSSTSKSVPIIMKHFERI